MCQPRLGAYGASLSPGRFVLSDLTEAGNRQMVNVRQVSSLNWTKTTQRLMPNDIDGALFMCANGGRQPCSSSETSPVQLTCRRVHC